MYKRTLYKKLCSLLVSLCILLSSNLQVLAQEPPKETELYAKSAVLMDADSGRILYDKNGSQAMANASTTKILTCILTLENCDLDSQVKVSSLAASQPKVRLGMREGQVFYLKDLLYGLMLESFNDCAVAIAEYIAGSTQSFAVLMNDKAKEIGCLDSYFITPNGLDAKDDGGFHHTTASDLALIMRYCIKLSEKSGDFLTITRTQQHSFTDLDGKSSYSCNNHNAFLQMMDGALSGKTGFTGNAGYCYIGALEQSGRTYIVALLACGWPNNKTYKWADTKKLMNYGLDNFIKKDINAVQPDAGKLAPVKVLHGQGDQIGADVYIQPIVKEEAGPGGILTGPDEEITLKYELAGELHAPVEEHAYIGKITWLLGDEILKECRVEAGSAVHEIDFPWCFDKVLELLCIFS